MLKNALHHSNITIIDLNSQRSQLGFRLLWTKELLYLFLPHFGLGMWGIVWGMDFLSKKKGLAFLG